jgi:hypothetical protein
MLNLAAINAWIIYRGVTGEKTSRHAFLRQLAEKLREVYKQKRESVVSKHNQEEQSQDKRKASKRHQCQVGICKCNKRTEKCEMFQRCMWKVRENCRKESLLQEMHAVTRLKITSIVSDVSWYRPI